MLKFLKYSITTFFMLLLVTVGILFLVLRASLPSLEGSSTVEGLFAPVTLERDAIGHAVINAETREDAAYALGFAHAQDRLFQMDTLRRSASGRLSELFGSATIEVDKRARFHRFEERAQHTFENLPEWQKNILSIYTKGVNDALDEYSVLPLEYLVTQSKFEPWTPKDSLLTIYSMYMDLQLSQVYRDLAFTRIAHHFGPNMVDFILQPSHHQAALDGSRLANDAELPDLSPLQSRTYSLLEEPFDIGSNSWAVSGNLTASKSAMLANDMHLSLRAPQIWYRTQLNYTKNNEDISVTGVSLPGSPGIVVGTNGKIAWGFTNANLDNTDWIELDYRTPIQQQAVSIKVAGKEPYQYTHLESEYGPVKRIDSVAYALQWVAHQDYAVNVTLLELDSVKSVEEAIPMAKTFGKPVQNFTLVDVNGNIAWTPSGAVTARETPSNMAISQQQYSEKWRQRETQLPIVYNPANQRIWTANARLISAQDFLRFGDGGYAVGARGEQIRDRLFDYNIFDEDRFYSIQLDNEARFLIPWHALLYRTLSKQKASYSTEINHLKNWQACACASSVGYTLTRRFRSQVMSALFEPISSAVEAEQVPFRYVVRKLEPATWDIINQQPQSWLPSDYANWDAFLTSMFDKSLNKLKNEFGNDESLQQLAWGQVNKLTIKHPMGDSIPFFGHTLHMPTHEGFGDSFMPAVQAPGFGASQRLFVRPGKLDSAVLTLPGGQSGHVLSPFYAAGFSDYVEQVKTPLLPQNILHVRRFEPFTP